MEEDGAVKEIDDDRLGRDSDITIRGAAVTTTTTTITCQMLGRLSNAGNAYQITLKCGDGEYEVLGGRWDGEGRGERKGGKGGI